MFFLSLIVTFWTVVITFMFVSSPPPTTQCKVADTTPFTTQAEVTLKTNFFGTRDVCTELLPLIKPNGKCYITETGISLRVNLYYFHGLKSDAQKHVPAYLCTTPRNEEVNLPWVLPPFIMPKTRDLESGSRHLHGCFTVSFFNLACTEPDGQGIFADNTLETILKQESWIQPVDMGYWQQSFSCAVTGKSAGRGCSSHVVAGKSSSRGFLCATTEKSNSSFHKAWGQWNLVKINNHSLTTKINHQSLFSLSWNTPALSRDWDKLNGNWWWSQDRE